jgi:hypothetical protein
LPEDPFKNVEFDSKSKEHLIRSGDFCPYADAFIFLISGQNFIFRGRFRRQYLMMNRYVLTYTFMPSFNFMIFFSAFYQFDILNPKKQNGLLSNCYPPCLSL